jgi:hypothetical protein
MEQDIANRVDRGPEAVATAVADDEYTRNVCGDPAVYWRRTSADLGIPRRALDYKHWPV